MSGEVVVGQMEVIGFIKEGDAGMSLIPREWSMSWVSLSTWMWLVLMAETSIGRGRSPCGACAPPPGA